MRRVIVEPTVVNEERGDETHPAWVLVGASRVASTPGAVLFDSDVQHGHYIVVSVRRARRRRDLNHDWKFGDITPIVSFAMSEAQWASFVSSMNVGDGVPATLEWDATLDNPLVPGMPFAPRLQVSIDEVHDAAERLVQAVRDAFDEYKAKPTKDNLRTLQARIDNMTPNMDYAAKSLGEHAENVVQRARADIESFVVQKARQLGIEPGELGTLELMPGSEEDRDA